MSAVIINNLTDISNMSYLELGIGTAANFNSINATNKVSVDVNGLATFTGTTDEYFASITQETKFDIIFIDANHDYTCVLSDFNNSIEHCTKWLLLHDMIPPSEGYVHHGLCSDSYKVLYHILKYEKFEVYPMNNNFGFTLIRMPAGKITPSEDNKNITYAEFMELISKTKLFSDEEVIKILSTR